MNTKEEIKAAEEYAEIHVLKHQPKEMFGNIVCDFLAGANWAEKNMRGKLLEVIIEGLEKTSEDGSKYTAQMVLDRIVNYIDEKNE